MTNELPHFPGDQEEKPEASRARLDFNRHYVGVPVSSFAELAASRKASLEIAQISYGSKDVSVAVTSEGSFCTFVHRNKNEKIEGDTTECYKRVRELIQEFANKEGKPMKYVLVTKSSSMTGWAQENGDKIFSWTRTSLKDYPLYSEFETVIHPVSSEKHDVTQ